MFIGHSRLVLDPKTLRLTIPSKLRDAVPPEELKSGFIAAVGLDGCLALYTESSWRAMASRRINLGEFDERTFQRLLFGTAERVHCDAQGRVVLPQRLVELVGLGGEVVVAGAEDRIEIWPPRRWADIESVQRLFYEQLAKTYYSRAPQSEPASAVPPAGDAAPSGTPHQTGGAGQASRAGVPPGEGVRGPGPRSG